MNCCDKSVVDEVMFCEEERFVRQYAEMVVVEQ